MTAAWGAVGFLLGTLTRSVGAAIAAGLLGVVVLEQLLGLAADALPVAAAIRTGPGAPGLTQVTTGPVAVAVLAAYVAGSFLLTAVVFRRRDVV